jgi:hypothetical protein
MSMSPQHRFAFGFIAYPVQLFLAGHIMQAIDAVAHAPRVALLRGIASSRRTR